MEEEFVLITEGINDGVGSLLAQMENEETLAPMVFFHHALTDAERKYCMTDKELLAVCQLRSSGCI